MGQHGKIDGSNTAYIVKVNYDSPQLWTEDEFSCAQDVLRHLKTASEAMQEAYNALPEGFDSSYLDGVQGDLNDMKDWYEDAIDNAEQIG